MVTNKAIHNASHSLKDRKNEVVKKKKKAQELHNFSDTIKTQPFVCVQ